jgi:uncharacterized protein
MHEMLYVLYFRCGLLIDFCMFISVKVKPNCKKAEVVRADDSLEVSVDAPARGGDANDRLIEILALYFHVAKSCVVIKRGLRSRIKNVEIIR